MFINRSSQEINLKLIYVGPALSGKDENLQYVYDHTSPESKGKMMSVSTETENTMFFDLVPKGLGAIQGFRVRLHLYTLAGPEEYHASTALLLKGADGIVFVADCRKGRLEATVEALERVKQVIRDQGRDWSLLPRTFQFNHHRLEDALPVDQVARALSVGSDASILADTRDGAGVFDTLKAATRELLVGLKEERVKEWEPTPEERKSGDQMISRVRVVSHYQEFFGEGIHEFGPWQSPPRTAPFFVMLHPPNTERPYFTYATFGLSTERQASGGPEPRVELMAYSEQESEQVAKSLVTIALMIADPGPGDVAFKNHDTVDIGDPLLPDAHFALVPPEEDPRFIRFPDAQRNMQDALFTHAVGEASDADAHVTFLKVLPLTADEAEFAAAKGTPALLEKFVGRPKYFGWGRGPGESVLAAPKRRKWF